MRGTKRIVKSILLMILVASMVMSPLTSVQVMAKKNTETTAGSTPNVNNNKYIGDGFTVEFIVTSQWQGALNGDIKITNTSNAVIDNWSLEFDFGYEITNIWNATIQSHEEGVYLVKNATWNKDIPAGGSVNFGISASCDGEVLLPVCYDIPVERQLVKNDYEITYVISSDWGSGFNGQISIKNNSDKVIEDWSLEFDFNRNITSFWTANIVSQNGNHYSIKNSGYNANIKPGETVDLGFGGNSGSKSDEPANYALYQIGQKTDIGQNKYVLNIRSSANGAVDPSVIGKYTEGSKILIKVVPDPYYNVDLWSSSAGGSFADNSAAETIFTMPGNDVSLEVNLRLSFDEQGDEDGDGLVNIHELFYGCDPYLEDTDEDGLNDNYEANTSLTDPLLKDTDDNSINDGDEDADKDKLSNINESNLGTDPLDEDTDADGFNDYDEVNVYATDPLSYDTDNDGLDDSAELEFGTNPTNPDTNGNGVLDGDELFHVQKTVSPEDADTNVIPTISMNIPGKSTPSLSIEKVSGDDFYLPEDMPGYIGAGYEFRLDEVFDSAVLTFAFNKDFLQDSNFEPAIYYCDEENQEMVLLENQHVDLNNGTVSADITHFSKYILLDKAIFEKIWNYEIKPPEYTNDPTSSFVIAMCVDSSGSMQDNDPNNIRKDAAKEFVDQLGENDEAAVVDFDSSAKLVSGLTSDKDVLYDAIDSIDNVGGTNIGAGVDLALKQIENVPDSAKYIILLTDGDGSYNVSLTQRAIDMGVVIYTIGLGDGVNTTLLESIAEQTGGKYYHATSADQLIDIFNDAAGETIDYETDTDGDGIRDYFEKLINKGKLLGFNGISYAIDMNIADTDSDGLNDGDEVIVIIGSRGNVYLSAKSSPVVKDTDYDGISDKADSKPANNSFVGTITQLNKGDFVADGEISFNVNYLEFFKNNKTYNKNIAVLSSVYAADIYDDVYIDVNNGATLTGNNSPDKLLKLFGMSDVQLMTIGTDNDRTEIAIGHHFVEYKGIKREIIQVVVRGTNGTFEEWSSNFDVGANTAAYFNETNSRQPEWTNRLNHKGFDVTANRVKSAIATYLSNSNLRSDAEKVIWITGHSRGAAISNILGAYYEDRADFCSYTYTFAAPNTTASDAVENYKSIFNILNEDDLIPQLPLDIWGFKKYGTDKKISVEQYYEDKSPSGNKAGTFEALMGGMDYNNNNKVQWMLNKFALLADNREELYGFTYANDTLELFGGWYYFDFNGAQVEANKLEDTTPSTLKQFCKIQVVEDKTEYGETFYITGMYQTTAYFMQTLALLAVSPGLSGLREVASKYEDARNSFIIIGYDLTGGLKHPHWSATYYLIAKNNQFK